MRSFFSLMNRFRRDRRGNIAVIFAIAAVPLISAIGCAIDYSEAARIKAKLQSAADAAAVASISQRSQGWLAASTMTTNGAGPGRRDRCHQHLQRQHQRDCQSTLHLEYAGTNAVVTKTGATLTATVNFSADVPTTFMKVAGFTKLTVSGVSAASATMPLYLDFYLALDVSASMGLPSTSTPTEAKPSGCRRSARITRSNTPPAVPWPAILHSRL